MKDVNKVILVGRLGADPVRRETGNGLAVASFSVATSRKGREDGVTQTQWHRVVTWGKQAEACATYLKKGHAVYIEGSMRTRKFEGKDGAAKMAFEIHAEDVGFLGSRSGRMENADSGADEPAQLAASG